MAANDLPARPAPANASKSASADPPITVVIPCYRAGATIDRAMDSALAQCGGRVAVVTIIDDLSAATKERIEERRDPRVRVLMNESNLGAPASRNRGLALAKTPFVAFLDADDFYVGDLLGALIARMEQEGTQVGFGPSRYWNPRQGYNYSALPDFKDREDVFLRWFAGIRTVNTASVVWSADYLRSIGGWDETIGRNQDGELALRAMLLGASFSMSLEGAGVWLNDVTLPRISTRTDNLHLLFGPVAKFERMHSEFIRDEVRVEACARHLHLIAHLSFRMGADKVGEEAMRRRRALGFADHEGSLKLRFSVATRMLKPRARHLFWQTAAALKAATLPVRRRLLSLKWVPPS